MKKAAMFLIMCLLLVGVLAGCDDGKDAVDRALDKVDPSAAAAFKKGWDEGAINFYTPTPSPEEKALEDAIARGVEKGIQNALGG